jgi:hypothetical protein
LNQLNLLFPDRNIESDGTIGDERHQHEKSDHNPNSAGVVTALDVTHDPISGCSGEWLSQALQKSDDRRIKYLIWNGKITVKGDISKWKPYEGFSAHTEHVHISVSSDRSLYDNTMLWDLSDIPMHINSTIQLGSKGPVVRALQKALGLKVDGIFGKDTDRRVRIFQETNGLREDGIVGKMTWKALGF